MTRYVGPAELLVMLGVGRTRLATLTSRPDFPPPAATVRMGSVWDVDKVIAWANTTGRTPNVENLPAHEDTVASGPPTTPIAAAELLSLLGVSQTRLAVLSRRPEFPSPAIKVKMGSIWDLQDITAWADASNRTLHLPAAENTS